MLTYISDLATQPLSWGTRGRGFESRRSDQITYIISDTYVLSDRLARLAFRNRKGPNRTVTREKSRKSPELRSLPVLVHGRVA
jgi:hypothetical protein